MHNLQSICLTDQKKMNKVSFVRNDKAYFYLLFIYLSELYINSLTISRYRSDMSIRGTVRHVFFVLICICWTCIPIYEILEAHLIFIRLGLSHIILPVVKNSLNFLHDIKLSHEDITDIDALCSRFPVHTTRRQTEVFDSERLVSASDGGWIKREPPSLSSNKALQNLQSGNIKLKKHTIK